MFEAEDISKVGSDAPRTGERVPPTQADRERLLETARQYVARMKCVPPVPLDELGRHCRAILAEAGLDEKYLGFAAVLVNNELWRDVVASVAFDRRLLLLPQCLRDAGRCGAKIDELGLFCARCGACSIEALLSEAERLGYVTLVAEGTPVVTTLIRSGRIDAIVGVGCLDSLEKVFPYMEAAAIPAMAIPLLRNGCVDTAIDMDWLWDAIYLSSDARHGPLQFDAQRRRVESWFAAERLDELLDPPDGQTAQIAREWLAGPGKRYRPLLTACAYEAFRDVDADSPVADQALAAAAVAIECFHKASLIHDDIEDQEALRYARPTMHRQYGVAVALNVGDFLLGEGYRLLAEMPVGPEARAEMLRTAAAGHRTLCLGQGAELCWLRRGGAISVEAVLEIFARKTAPAFDVALRLGAILAGADESVLQILRAYSEALGIAYQIRDDLAELAAGDLAAIRPSLLAALAYERAEGEAHAVIECLWTPGAAPVDVDPVREILMNLRVDAEARRLMDTYKRKAVDCLAGLTSVRPKALLRRVLAGIVGEV